MHEQIKKLYDKAWAETTDHHATMQKFAELIVRECLKVGEDYSEDFYHFKDEILKHFGVEE